MVSSLSSTTCGPGISISSCLLEFKSECFIPWSRLSRSLNLQLLKCCILQHFLFHKIVLENLPGCVKSTKYWSLCFNNPNVCFCLNMSITKVYSPMLMTLENELRLSVICPGLRDQIMGETHGLLQNEAIITTSWIKKFASIVIKRSLHETMAFIPLWLCR